MGIMQPYFPKEITLKIAAIANAKIFVETGTYYGHTTKWASTQFTQVFTIELSEYLYSLTKDQLLSMGNIIPNLGDSRIVLPQILKKIDGNIVFWLDGHYSTGVTAGADDPCPLMKELEIILQRNNDDIILIDDARCCITERGGGWPSIVEIYKIIKANEKNKRHIQICNDHIYIIPDKDEYKKILIEYVLNQDLLLWQLYQRVYAVTFKAKLYRLSIDALKKLRLYNIIRSIKKLVKDK
jgi:hypothetical protein